MTGDFHEFALGFVFDQGHFYISLSMAMHLLSGQQQKSDRGRTLKIAHDGSNKTLSFSLQTPDGIGLGVGDDHFVTDNHS